MTRILWQDGWKYLYHLSSFIQSKTEKKRITAVSSNKRKSIKKKLVAKILRTKQLRT